MEELFSLVAVIVVVIVNAISISSKSKKQTAAEEARKAAAAARIKAAQQKLAEEAHQAAEASAEVSASGAKPAPMQVLQPTVHAHIAPDCAEHDAPTSGSLDFVSTEGKDPCHEDELTLVRQPAEVPVPTASGLTFDWSGDNLVKAFVMQELLQRPGTRNRR